MWSDRNRTSESVPCKTVSSGCITAPYITPSIDHKCQTKRCVNPRLVVGSKMADIRQEALIDSIGVARVCQLSFWLYRLQERAKINR